MEKKSWTAEGSPSVVLHICKMPLDVLPAPEAAISCAVLIPVSGMMLRGQTSAWLLLFPSPLCSSPASQSLSRGSGVSCACSGRSDLLGQPGLQVDPKPNLQLPPSSGSAAHRLQHPWQPRARASGGSAPAEGAPTLLPVFF